MIFGKWQTYFCNRCDDEFIVTGQWEEPHCPNCGEDDQTQLAATNERVPVSDLPSVMAKAVEKYFDSKDISRIIFYPSKRAYEYHKDCSSNRLGMTFLEAFTHIIAEAPLEAFEAGQESILDQIKEVAETGILPDGDHVNMSTAMWLESLMKVSLLLMSFGL